MLAMPLTTYYVYTLDAPPPQALMRRCFGERRLVDRDKITAWAWTDIRQLGQPDMWRREDWDVLKRLQTVG